MSDEPNQQSEIELLEPEIEPEYLPRNKGGRPRFQPTRQQRRLVQIMAANGTSQEIMANNILWSEDNPRPIDLKTLRKAFRAELDYGYAQTVAHMGVAIVNQGLNGNIAAARYWMQTHGGDEWRVTENIRHGLTSDTPAQGLVAPVLVIQPVLPASAVKPNNGAVPGNEDLVPLEDYDDAGA